MPKTIGVILLSFGTAASVEDVPAYLSRVRGGRPVPPETVAEMQSRYQQVGGSPLLRITKAQAQALEEHLNPRPSAVLGAMPVGAAHYRVTIGMRNSAPYIADALKELVGQGIRETIAIIMAPQHSPMIMKAYHEAIAKTEVPIKVRTALAWHTVPSFHPALAQRVKEALARLPTEERDRIPVLMSTHSLPRQVVETEPVYLEMLQHTASEVARLAGLHPSRWLFAYQSAAHTPEEWLKPDIKDIFPALAEQGHNSVLIVPVQFVADHLEILYDIDIAAKQQAADVGLTLHRIEMFNTMPAFIQALAEVVHREEHLLQNPTT